MPFALLCKNTINTLNNWKRRWTMRRKAPRKYARRYRDCEIS